MSGKNGRLRPSQIEADRATIAALRAIVGYAPTKPECSVAAVMALEAETTAAQDAETQIEGALAAARDKAAAKASELHERVLDIKDQVMAQFGRNSDEVQALGLKKASERKAPSRRKASAEAKV